MDFLLNLIPGGSLTAIAAAVVAALAGVWRIYASGKKAGRNEEGARHAEDRDENLERIKRAADARPSGSVSDDPRNRDR